MDAIEQLPGYLNDSAGWDRPAVLVNHEWWGANRQIREVADRLAKEGFVTFVPDLYHGKVATDPEGAAKLMRALDWKRAMRDLAAAVAAVRAKAAGAVVGIMGFSLGGAVALMGAARVPEFRASVAYYGIPEGVDLSSISIPVQGHYATQDTLFTPGMVDALEAALKKGGGKVELYRYDAPHAFANESHEVHRPEHARTAWDRTVKFLHQHLG